MRLWLAALVVAGCAPAPVEAPARSPKRAPAVTPARVETLSSGARRIHIDDPGAYWKDGGFVELAPPVRLAISAHGRPHVAVLLKLPDSPPVRAHELADPARATLVFPPGSEADRVSSKRYAGGLTVADVRGSRIDEDGREWFHVYRPASPEPNAPLVGFEWLRDDPAQRQEATRLLVEHVRSTAPALATRTPSDDSVAFFSRMNACERCHFPNKAAGVDPDDALPLWPTDQIGWYVPLAVMLPELALSTTPRWHDPNVDDVLVARRCANGNATQRRRAAGSWFRCDDGSVPHGSRDIPLGLELDDAYTRAVCRSRSYVYERMDREAQLVFMDAMTPCDKPVSSASKR